MDALAREEEGFPAQLAEFVAHSKETIEELDAWLCFLGDKAIVIGAYGASAKGTMLINLLSPGAQSAIGWCVDSTPWKVGCLIPGTRIPITPESHPEKPSVFLLTAWNYATEIIARHADFTALGGKFLVPLPRPILRP